MPGGGGSPSGNTTTVTKSDPWAGQQPYLSNLYGAAEGLRQAGGPNYFPGQTLATPNDFSTGGLTAMGDRGAAGSPLISGADSLAQRTLGGHFLNNNPASKMLQSTAQGQYLNPGSNPFLMGAYNQGANALEGSTRSAWGGQDTLPGAPGEQAALANAQGNLATNIFGGAYAQERQNQLAATGQIGQNYDAERQRQQQTAGVIAPTLANQDYTDLNARVQAGQGLTGLDQTSINDAIQRYNYQQNQPYANLANYAQLISGSPGGSQTTTQPYFGGGGLGLGGGLGGIGGAALGGLAFGGPFGAVAGGLLGSSLFR